MGSNYLITPKEFNGTDYDTLYFKTVSQQVLLNDSALATLMNLSGNPTINDVLTNGMAMVQIASYVGTNESGADHPCSITFSFAPDLIIYVGIGEGNAPVITDGAGIYWTGGEILTNTFTTGVGLGIDTSAAHYGRKTNNGKTIEWYAIGSTSPASAQLNYLGYRYWFIGIKGWGQLS